MNFSETSIVTCKNVPRETFLKLEQYQALILKWQKALNLISNRDVKQLFVRHILDSLQLIDHLRKGVILDIGTGGGFPGIVLAISTDENVILVESDQRKSIFLEEVKLKLNLKNLEIYNGRIENFSCVKKMQNITARAFSSLKNLIKISKSLLAISGQCLFFKGASYKKELDESLSAYKFDYEIIKSKISKGGAIIKIHFNEQTN
ncbi:MAG: 16S rRNA (guanine(527)-N(7))-methyltransferase RsmG [Holosporales bacterium]|jgi:16S rRNA (guanine527-N7)-methyltransferase|nr:16S rRNA (guanine(527)-N(7))-methyltransferase RsmG [Holosporales bacterium]